MEQVRASWPQPDSIPEATRAEQRFAAEVSIAQLRGELVPTYAVERANTILQLMARA